MEFECPNCEKEFEIEAGDLPERSSDEMEWECPNCEKAFKIGWYATLEVRQ